MINIIFSAAIIILGIVLLGQANTIKKIIKCIELHNEALNILGDRTR